MARRLSTLLLTATAISMVAGEVAVAGATTVPAGFGAPREKQSTQRGVYFAEELQG